MQPPFFLGIGTELALHATHAADHGIEVLQHILLGGPAGESCGCGVFEEGFERRGVLLNSEVGSTEVFA
jgi:hypothetical protein